MKTIPGDYLIICGFCARRTKRSLTALDPKTNTLVCKEHIPMFGNKVDGSDYTIPLGPSQPPLVNETEWKHQQGGLFVWGMMGDDVKWGQTPSWYWIDRNG